MGHRCRYGVGHGQDGETNGAACPGRALRGSALHVVACRCYTGPSGRTTRITCKALRCRCSHAKTPVWAVVARARTTAVPTMHGWQRPYRVTDDVEMSVRCEYGFPARSRTPERVGRGEWSAERRCPAHPGVSSRACLRVVAAAEPGTAYGCSLMPCTAAAAARSICGRLRVGAVQHSTVLRCAPPPGASRGGQGVIEEPPGGMMRGVVDLVGRWQPGSAVWE